MPSANSPIRIGLVDDHPLTLAGLRGALATRPGLEVAWEATDGARALALCEETPPDLVLTDLLLPDMTAPDVIRALRARGVMTRVLILSSSAGSENIHRAFAAGASGYLLKSAGPDALFRAIEDAHAGRRVVPNEVAERLAERAPESDLTPRELEVLKQLVEGGTNHDIARALGMSAGTVRTHLSKILLKLGVDDRAGAVAAALRRGFVRDDL